MNPLSRVLAALGAVLLLVGAVFFGLIVLALAVGLGVVAWLAFNLRLWWLRRQLEKAGGVRPDSSRDGQVIDADYEVVSREERD